MDHTFPHGDHQPDHRPVTDDAATIAHAWHQQLAEAGTNSRLLTALRQAPPTLERRFVRAYRDLVALARPRRRKLLRRMGLSLGGTALVLALGLSPVPAARAASISVGGSCTLVDAITAANTDTATGGCTAGSGADTITLSGDVTLTSVNNMLSGGNGLPLISSAITINGAGFTIARDPSAPAFRILRTTASGNLTLQDITISGGTAVPYQGGGVYNASGGTLTISNSTISGNSGQNGGGILSRGTLTISDSTMSGNSGGGNNSGGALYSGGATTISNSTISDNSARFGGGLFIGGSVTTISDSTISGNSANIGGGLYNYSTLTLARSLISGNTAPSGADVVNSAGGGFPPRPPATLNAANFNLFGHSGLTNGQALYGFTPSGSDITATSDGTQPTALTAILAPTLQNNGGPTLTHALVSGSPAVDAATTGPATDQRGVARPQGAAFDIGAFELEQAAGADLAVVVSDTPDPAALGDSVTYTVTVTNAGPTGATSVSAATTLSGASATILSATSSQGSCAVSAPTVNCSLGTLAASASATITITVEPNATGTITASATVSASEADPTSGNNSASESTTITNAYGCTITGTPGNDTLNGTNGADVMCGLGGNDTIAGGNGADTIYAGSGNDMINGGNGNDTVYAGAGDDTSYGETLLGLLDNGSDTLYGGPGNDTLNGQNGDDTLIDTEGTDQLTGATGNDTIVTQDGFGGDTATGGLGSDTCTVDVTDTTSGC